MMGDREDPRVVRYDTAMGLSTVFRSLPKGPRPKLDLRYEPKSGGMALKFTASDALGIPEQTLLLALLEIAQLSYNACPESALLDENCPNEIGQQLWANLLGGRSVSDRQTLCFSTSWLELAAHCGLSKGGTVQAMLQLQLQRLCQTTVWEYEESSSTPKCQSFLVGWVKGKSRSIHLVLNFRLSAAIFGERYASISMVERLALSTDVARAVHAFLSSTLRLGVPLSIGLSTLAGRLWPDRGPKLVRGTDRRQKKSIRDALHEISTLSGWTISAGATEVLSITRKTGGARDMTTRHFASRRSTYREQSATKFFNVDADFGTFDASGLFSTREEK